VSNRHTTGTAKIIPFPGTNKTTEYSTEIKAAINSISDKEQESEKTQKPDQPIKELDDLRDIYSSLEQQNTDHIDYEALFSYLEHNLDPASYENQEEDQESWVMSDQEAEETIHKIQSAYLIGNKDNISHKEKERFHHWQEFNKTLLMFYHVLSPIRNDNINYNRAA